jgi:hypothetical protein
MAFQGSAFQGSAFDAFPSRLSFGALLTAVAIGVGSDGGVLA